MNGALRPLSLSNRRKFTSILLAVVVFALLAALTTSALGRPVRNGILNAFIIGTGVGLFEEFYVQSRRGRWLRNMHPLQSILIYTVVVIVIFLMSIHLVRLLLWNFSDLLPVYRRLPKTIPIVITYSVVAVVVMRVVHFIGIETLFHLMVGTYHRPVLETKILLFLDINDSTGLASRLGAVATKAFVGKFLFDISAPITNNGGDIYLYKGDGLIALWGWHEGVSGGRILRAIDAIFAAIRDERAAYLQQFGVVPPFRIGVHGGEVVVSEQGDTKRAIGIYGNTINIAQRMEEAAKVHGVACVISADVADVLAADPERLVLLGEEHVRGISTAIPIFEYRVRDAAASPGNRFFRRRSRIGVA